MKKVLSLITLFLIAGAAAFAGSPKPTIHLMGDSTCAPKDLTGGNPERGWGMMLPNFLDNGIEVINYARNGRSTKSFQDLGHWDFVKSALKPGDFVFIQFGHNDAKQDDPARYAEAWGAYSDNLRLFIKTAREAGATPVLLTPVSRRWFKNGELDLNCHGDYPAAMKKVAEETGTTLLDITSATQDWLVSLGDEASRPYFMWIAPGTVPACPEGKEDNTHTKANGARKVASIVVEAIRRSGLDGIKSHLLDSPADIVVAQDGTGDYMTVQEAIDASPDYAHEGMTTIRIKAGTYREMVTIPANKSRLHIIGDGAEKTIITYDKYARQLWPDSSREVGTSGSASVYVHASYVTFEDVTIENCAGEGKGIDQAVALFTDGDFLFFHRCRLIGNQDTLYTFGRYGADGGIKRNYFLDCYIEGTTDFIFGPSIAYFDNCTIHSKKNSYVTAASTLQGQDYGYVFRNCRLTAVPGVDKVYLGRPWGAYAKTVFLECELGAHIVSEGWHNWEKEGKPNTEKNSYYAEYRNYGPGAAGKPARVKWSYQLTDRQAAAYTFEKVMFQPQDGIVWKPLEDIQRTADNDRKSVDMVRSEMKRCPEATYLDGHGENLKWNYTTGLELKAMLDVYRTYGDEDIFEYAEKWYDSIIDSDGKIATYSKEAYNTDHVCPARTLFYLYGKTGKKKYRAAMDSIYVQLSGHPRTSEGGFWHKATYPSQMWLDGLYMAQPFYAEYNTRFNPEEVRDSVYRDIINHFDVVARHTYDPATSLYRHAWDESRDMFWCDPVTGQSKHAWGRALGWYSMALVDVLEWIPEKTEGRERLVEILKSIVERLPAFADPQTGMWYQVLDRPGQEGNYVEATCSAMFIYAMLKGVRLGVLDASVKDYASDCYGKYLKTFVRVDEDGLTNIDRCCAVAGLGGKDRRSGDYNYYINEKVISNDCKGVGPFIWASLEMEEK